MKQTIITILYAFIFLVTLWMVSVLMGCAQHISTEAVVRNGVEYRSEVKQNLFLWYRTKDIDHVTDFSSVSIGQTTPDPNTASVIVQAVGTWLGGGL